jgi:hypothetical protein
VCGIYLQHVKLLSCEGGEWAVARKTDRSSDGVLVSCERMFLIYDEVTRQCGVAKTEDMWVLCLPYLLFVVGL